MVQILLLYYFDERRYSVETTARAGLSFPEVCTKMRSK